MSTSDHEVAIIGGGIVGCAVAYELARRGVPPILFEAEPGLGLGASGTNSGILHTGFDSYPGELETRLILRSHELRRETADTLRVPTLPCGAMLRPRDDRERATVREIAQRARANGVPVHARADGALEIPGEAVTDPVAFVHTLAGAAQGGGAELRLRAQVESLRRDHAGGWTLHAADGTQARARYVLNCAGLYADAVARLAGDEIVDIYPRKGEFLVFALASAYRPRQILLPVPSAMGKGVLVFPTLDGHVIAGPTAREREDKEDWSVEPDAVAQIIERAAPMHPPLRDASPVAAYVGLRPAGRGANYVITPSPASPSLIHVAAIRSTGLSASLGIAEYVTGLCAQAGLALGPPLELAPHAVTLTPVPPPSPAWWERAIGHHGA
jgi:glycerol-3-phosphate dehydrogenase